MLNMLSFKTAIISIFLLLLLTLLNEFILFPLAERVIFSLPFARKLEFSREKRNKMIKSVLAMIFIRFLIFGIILGYIYSQIDFATDSLYCGLKKRPAFVNILWVMFTLYCAHYITESFSPTFKLQQTTFEWIHHVGLWINWLIYVTFKIEDETTIALVLVYGTLIFAFAWTDMMQILRYFAPSNPKLQYRYFQIYYFFKCINFTAFVVVPLTWAQISFQKGCLDLPSYVAMSFLICLVGLPDIFMLFTTFRQILTHYKEKSEESTKSAKNETEHEDSCQESDVENPPNLENPVNLEDNPGKQ